MSYQLQTNRFALDYTPETSALTVTVAGRPVVWSWANDPFIVLSNGKSLPFSNAACESHEFATGVDRGVRATYSGFTELYIGLQETAKVGGGAKYAYDKPIVYYGSSITQGGCASRPGTCYEAIISRKLNVDHINLGFSGAGKGEKAIVDYMASLDPLIFVCDYDHNAPNIEHLEPTHLNLYETFRASHPTTPYVMVTKPDFAKPRDTTDEAKRRAVIHKNFMKGIEKGDKNLYFIDGESFFAGYADGGDCTVDGCHPTDLGFFSMAKRFYEEICKIDAFKQ
jgi:hypothetical protein